MKRYDGNLDFGIILFRFNGLPGEVKRSLSHTLMVFRDRFVDRAPSDINP